MSKRAQKTFKDSQRNASRETSKKRYGRNVLEYTENDENLRMFL